jgi:hypothetical protein
VSDMPNKESAKECVPDVHLIPFPELHTMNRVEKCRSVSTIEHTNFSTKKERPRKQNRVGTNLRGPHRVIFEWYSFFFQSRENANVRFRCIAGATGRVRDGRLRSLDGSVTTRQQHCACSDKARSRYRSAASGDCAMSLVDNQPPQRARNPTPTTSPTTHQHRSNTEAGTEHERVL